VKFTIRDEVVVELLPGPEPNYNLADVVDVLAAIEDPTSSAAHRVKLATDPVYSIRYFQDLLCEQLRVPAKYLVP
jgi:hypothetical protein